MPWSRELKMVVSPGWWQEQRVKERLARDAERVLRQVGIESGQKVLDYGCGPGAFALPAARIVGEKGQVYALDIAKPALMKLRSRADSEGLQNIRTILAEEGGIASVLAGEEVDVVLLYDVLHHIEDKEALLRDLHEMLVDDGIVSIYPMHLAKAEVIELAEKDGLFALREEFQGILNFTKV